MAVPIRLHLLLSKTYFQPGDAVSATIQIANDAGPDSQGDTHIRELSFQARGSERTDPSWIVQLYRPDTPADKNGSRKLVRCIFATEPTALVRNVTLLPHSAQQFNIRFRLPTTLPPTFKGSSIRFSYTVDVRAVYEVPSAGTGAPVLYETTATTTLLVWPHPARAPQPAAERRAQSLAHRSASAAGQAALLNPPQTPRALSPRVSLQPQQPQQPPSPLAGGAPGGGGGSGGLDRASTSGGGGTPAAAAAGASAPQTAAVAAAAAAEESETPLIVYRLNNSSCKVRWQEVTPGEILPSATRSAMPPPPKASSTAGHSTPTGGHSTPARRTSGDGSRDGGHNQPSFTHELSRLHLSAGGASSAPSSGGGGGSRMRPDDRDRQLSLTLDSESGEEDVMYESTSDMFASGARQLVKAESSSGRANGRQAGGAESAAQQQQLQSQQSLQQQRGSARLAGGAGAAVMGARDSFVAPRRLPQFGRSYVLNAGEGQPVIKILLQTPLQGPLQLGSTFGGVLDFRGRGASGAHAMCCHQVVIMLEAEEVISSECRPAKSRRAAAAAGGGSGVMAEGSSIRKLYCEHQEITTDTVLSHFQFTVPATATPSFRTPMVTLRWVLRFELSVGPASGYTNGGATWGPPAELQQLVWALPLVVQAPIAAAR